MSMQVPERFAVARLAQWTAGLVCSILLTVFLLIIEAACLWRALLDRLGARGAMKASSVSGLRVLAVGTFYHSNWYRAHLAPLAGSEAVGELRVVSPEAGEPIDKVRWCVAPAWLRRAGGRNAARALTAARQALCWRPKAIIGYFIFPNALLALLLARLIGAAAVYQMGGGPLEFQRCGRDSENPFLRRVLPRFPGLHPLLMRAIGRFDLIVVRGSAARADCRARFPRTRIRILTAGIDCERFRPMPEAVRRYDVVTVARLSALKRVDVLVKALAQVSRDRPNLSALIVGDGPERSRLERLGESLGLNGRLHFAGTRDDVETPLNQSRLFVLCSDSEGFSIAMAEAMACGLPAVVSDVGELGELVRNDRTGRLVARGDAAAFAEAIAELLDDPERLAALSAQAAIDAGRLCASRSVSARWTRVLRELTGRPQPRAGRLADLPPEAPTETC